MWVSVLAPDGGYQAVSRPGHQRSPPTPGHIRSLGTKITLITDRQLTPLAAARVFCCFGHPIRAVTLHPTGPSSVCAYLSCTVAAQSLQMLPVGQVAGQPAVLQRDAGVDEGCGSAVVVHKEGLREKRTLGVRDVCLKVPY